jgi:hypothetical protein
MQMNEKEKENHWREILNKEWSKDFPTLSNKEIQKMILLAFYQLFLIEVDSIKIISDINSGGHFVRFEIEGEAYMDSVNLQQQDLEE